ncbi:hypothetical protein C8Q77DRAFT_58436 [Trametes polyzona]|nr:hypothetical protein C8Q77DRAFT_58436 [Trametes polyzona]
MGCYRRSQPRFFAGVARRTSDKDRQPEFYLHALTPATLCRTRRPRIEYSKQESFARRHGFEPVARTTSPRRDTVVTVATTLGLTLPAPGTLYENASRLSTACVPLVARPGATGSGRHIQGSRWVASPSGRTGLTPSRRRPRIPSRLHEAPNPAPPWTVRMYHRAAGL